MIRLAPKPYIFSFIHAISKHIHRGHAAKSRLNGSGRRSKQVRRVLYDE
ncbi:hypothetical protein [Leptolyngbya sp. FACHB-17]|nr:hypothetical protein [Leptolyngbya sp. FACHB-17]MBD2079921.1 hypothetical protein [Leptolyngbya sp. FACHB-17]